MPPTSPAKPISYAQSTGLPISPSRFQISAPAARKASANINPKVCSVTGPILISGYIDQAPGFLSGAIGTTPGSDSTRSIQARTAGSGSRSKPASWATWV